MARSHAKKNMSKDPSFRKTKPLEYLPVQRKITLATVSGSTTTGIIDAGRLLSTSNHRLYRYGKRYNLKIDIDPSVAATNTIDVWALADTWAVQKAFEEAKRVFDKAYINERENLSKDARARWFDFRANIGVSGDTMFAAVTQDPNPGTLALLTAGEFNGSIVEDNLGVTRIFSWNPTTTPTAYSIPAEYDLAGNTSTSPTTPTGGGPYEDLQADSSAIEMQALQDRGNLPPYDADNFPAVWVKIATLGQSAAGSQRLSTGYFDAPCGQVVLRSSAPVTELSGKAYAEFKTGDYKGVKAHNMERV